MWLKLSKHISSVMSLCLMLIDWLDSDVNTYQLLYWYTRYGQTGIYKAYLFGKPTIIVTAPETSRRVLTDDTHFKAGWPKSTTELLGKSAFMGSSAEEHKRLRKLTAAPISGHKALSMYHEYIKDVIVTSLDEWSKSEEPIEFLTEIRKLTFKIVMHIFLSSEIGPMLETLEKDYTTLNHGIRSMAINLPGFAYHKALKVRFFIIQKLKKHCIISSLGEKPGSQYCGNGFPTMLVIFACFNFSCVTCALNPSFLCLNKNLAENPGCLYI